MYAILQPHRAQPSSVPADLVVDCWDSDDDKQAEPSVSLSFWLAYESPSPECRRVAGFAGRLAPDAAEQRSELVALLGSEPPLPTADRPSTFLAICRLTGERPTPDDIAGHRRNSARNFDRMLAAVTLFGSGEQTQVDCTCYLFEAPSREEVSRMIGADPLSQCGFWKFEVFPARIVQNSLLER